MRCLSQPRPLGLRQSTRPTREPHRKDLPNHELHSTRMGFISHLRCEFENPILTRWKSRVRITQRPIQFSAPISGAPRVVKELW
jgi:hypothetical protein